MKRGILIYNPTAGQRDLQSRMSELIDRMRARGLELVNTPTTGQGHATEIVRTFLARGIDVVVVCGGDGTISEAASGLAGSEVPLAVLPGGTSNVLAREIGIPFDLEQAEALLLEGLPRSVRVVRANDRPFLLWAGTGLDARVMGRMNQALKRRLGRAGIFVTAAYEFFTYEFPRLEVAVDGVAYEATFAVVCHARHYGGKWIIAPEASLASDTLDVMLFSGRSRWSFYRLFQEMERRRLGHLEDGIARIVRGREVRVRSLEDYEVEVHVDGDCVLQTPITCRAGTETVRILAPPEAGGLTSQVPGLRSAI